MLWIYFFFLLPLRDREKDNCCHLQVKWGTATLWHHGPFWASQLDLDKSFTSYQSIHNWALFALKYTALSISTVTSNKCKLKKKKKLFPNGRSLDSTPFMEGFPAMIGLLCQQEVEQNMWLLLNFVFGFDLVLKHCTWNLFNSQQHRGPAS